MRFEKLLCAKAPFRLDLTAWVLRRRPDNKIDQWDGQAYQRAFLVEGRVVETSVSQVGPDTLCARVSDPGIEVESILTRVLALNADMQPFYDLARSDDRLNGLALRFQGVHPPRFASVFEAIVNAVCCQQLSLTVGLRILTAISEEYGKRSESGLFTFPEPEDLAAASYDRLRQLKLSSAKSATLISVGEAFASGSLTETELEALPDAEVVERLCQLKGIGRWSAEYALLRGLGRTHLFPGDDVGARGRLQKWLGLEEKLDYQKVHDLLLGWREFGGLVYFHMLLAGLDESGVLQMPPAR